MQLNFEYIPFLLAFLAFGFLGASIAALAGKLRILRSFTSPSGFPIDGDTIQVFRNGSKVRVRLENIDAPEMSQGTAGRESRERLRYLLRGDIEIRPRKKDRYGRLVAQVIADGKDLSLEMVSSGHAFASPYAGRFSRIARLSRKARRKKFGIFRNKHLQAPWAARRQV